MSKKVVTWVFGFLLINLLLFFINAFNKDIIELVHKGMSTYVTIPTLIYEENSGVIERFFRFAGLLIIYIVFLLGIVLSITSLLRKEGQPTSTYEDIEEHLVEALLSVENGEVEHVINAKVISYLTAMETEIRRIFNLKRKKLDVIWYLPKENDDGDYELFYLKPAKDINSLGALIDRTLEEEGIRFKDKSTKDRYDLDDCRFNQFITVRNYGKVRFGVALGIYEDNILNDFNEQEFIKFTTNMLLLGYNKEFVEAIRKAH
ncbi:hypothetical protein [Virgibacillus siamensis]|uniref:hypothetical protein n=1 Tax=Virgibacillus siamensis TaxID=480071 RepID=UPI000984625B|nr:hypothetical protein [Virgibacillus siamensis]